MKKLSLLIALLLTAAAAGASTVMVQFQGFSGPGWWAGYPYYASVNGQATSNVMCDDWEHGGLPGDTWQANVTDLGTGNLTNLRFKQLPNALTLYREVGWLLLETQVSPQSQWTDINYAVWYIFDANTPLSPNAQAWVAAAQQEAAAGFPGVNFHNVEILTPVNQYDPNPDGPQELLTQTPEPTTLVLLGGGLLALCGRRWTR